MDVAQRKHAQGANRAERWPFRQGQGVTETDVHVGVCKWMSRSFGLAAHASTNRSWHTTRIHGCAYLRLVHA